MPIDSSFMRHVDIRPGEHWGWTGNRTYGRTTGAPRFKNRNAARYAYEEEHGPLPSSTPYVRATCDMPQCVNPDHLEPVASTPGMERRSSGSDAGELAELRALVESQAEELAELRRQIEEEMVPSLRARFTELEGMIRGDL